MLVADLEQHTPETCGIGRSSCAVCVVPAVMLSTRIVEHGEQPDNFLDRSTPSGNEQTVALDSTPV
jgi:hypothetical protein